MLDAAASSPTPDAVQKMEWVLDAGSSSLRAETAAAAVGTMHGARLVWLWDRGCSFCSRKVLEAALRNTVLIVLEWLVQLAGCPLPDRHDEEAVASAYEAAAGSGRVHHVLWLQVHGVPRPRTALDRAMREAARCGELEVVRLLHQLEDGDALLSTWVMDAAVESGSVETAAYLKAAGCRIHQSSAWGHAKQSVVGSVGMLRWLLGVERLQGSRGLVEVLKHWSGKGYSELLLLAVQLMVKRGDRPAYDGCCLFLEVEAAAAGGELGVLRYLHEELGWKLVGGAMVGAARGGCEETAEWLWQRRCRVRNSGYCYHHAARNGDRGMMERLWRLGLRWGVVTLQEVLDDSRVQLPALQWMWERAPGLYGSKDLERAIRRREASSVRRSEAREQQVAAWLREKLAEL